MADEYKDGWVNFEWLKELADKADTMGKIDRQKEEAKKAAEVFRMYFDAFVSAGFDEDQAMDLLMGLFGVVTGR